MRPWTNPPTWRKTSRLRWPPDSGPNQTNQALISRAKASGSRPARLRPGFPVTAGRPGNARPCLRRRCRPPAAQTGQSHRRFCAGSNGILRLNRSLVSEPCCISPWAFQGDHAKLSKLDSAAMIASWDSTWYWGAVFITGSKIFRGAIAWQSTLGLVVTTGGVAAGGGAGNDAAAKNNSSKTAGCEEKRRRIPASVFALGAFVIDIRHHQTLGPGAARAATITALTEGD